MRKEEKNCGKKTLIGQQKSSRVKNGFRVFKLQQKQRKNNNQMNQIQHLQQEQDDLQIQQQRFQTNHQQHTQVSKKPPSSAFVLFIKQLNKDHKRASLKQAAQLWKQISQQEKQFYKNQLQKQKLEFEQYLALHAQKDSPIPKQHEDSFFFPNHKIKHIMKKDPAFTTIKGDAICAMNLATEYFGRYVLGLLKKRLDDNKRKKFNLQDLYEMVRSTNNLQFLNGVVQKPESKSKLRISSEIINQQEKKQQNLENNKRTIKQMLENNCLTDLKQDM